MKLLIPLVAALAVGQTDALSDPKVAAQLDKLSLELLEAHNKERAANKLPPFTLEPRLRRAAERHAHDMAQHKRMSHEGSDNSQAAERVKREKYHYMTVGENVAVGQKDVKRVVQAWMDSPGHRANILGDFTQIGAGVFKDEDGAPYWCVDFASPIPKLDPAVAARDVLAAINKKRVEEEKPKLLASSKLDSAALAIARECATRKGLEPKEGEPQTDHIKKSGYRFEAIAQAAASGAPTPERLAAHFLDDPERAKEVLDDYKEIGIGYAQDDEETPYWVLLLAKPRRAGR